MSLTCTPCVVEINVYIVQTTNMTVSNNLAYDKTAGTYIDSLYEKNTYFC